MPGWIGSTRRTTLPTNWQTVIVPRIMNRDHHQCQWIRRDTGRPCHAPATDIDHRTPHSAGGTDHDSNLWALCTWHHRRKTGSEGGHASAQARARRAAEAPKPLHPGLLTTAPDRTPPPF